MMFSILANSRAVGRKSMMTVRSFHVTRSQWRDLAPAPKRGPLEGVRVLDLTRVLGKQKNLYWSF
jgi:hypothetical protein